MEELCCTHVFMLADKHANRVLDELFENIIMFCDSTVIHMILSI